MIATTLTTYVAKKGVEHFAKAFAKDVIERGSRKRAINFFGAFVEAVGQGNEEIDIAQKLDGILASEANAEILFEAHRMVCLSRSKHIGPRAIALLTAQIVLEGRQAAGIEEPWFQVYESFSDMELIATVDFYEKAFAKAADETAKDYKIKGNQLVIEWSSETDEALGEVDRSPFNFHEYLGPWAGKLANLGLIHATSTERTWNYKADGEYVDEDGTSREIKYWLHLNAFDKEHIEIIARAHRMVPLGDLGQAKTSFDDF